MGGIGHCYTNEENNFIKEYAYGHSWKEIQEAFEERFEWRITTGQLKGRMRKLGVITGNTGRFGDVEAYNKERKLSEKQYASANPTMFKNGNTPHNTAEVGKEVVLDDGYIKVKIAQPNKWKLKHYLVWEAAYGPLPAKSCIMFLDRDRQNCDLSNLRLVTKEVNNILNRNNMLTDNAEINETVIRIAEYMATAGIGTLDALEKNKNKRFNRVLKLKRKKEDANG